MPLSSTVSDAVNRIGHESLSVAKWASKATLLQSCPKPDIAEDFSDLLNRRKVNRNFAEAR